MHGYTAACLAHTITGGGEQVRRENNEGKLTYTHVFSNHDEGL